MSGQPFTWHSASVTHPGKVRTINEDALLDHGDIGLWVVADGMGGHEAGDLASNMIVEELRGITRDAEPGAFLDRVEDRLLQVNRRLFETASAGGEHRTIGSTVVVLIVFRRYCIVLWAGDSRAYRLREGRLRRVTTDHSQVEEMVEQGELLREDAETHPLANVITRAVGGAEDLYLDIELKELRDGDRYLLCSDGLYKDVSEEEVGTLLGTGDCAAAAQALVDVVLEREAADNVTVSVIDFVKNGDDSGN